MRMVIDTSLQNTCRSAELKCIVIYPGRLEKRLHNEKKGFDLYYGKIIPQSSWTWWRCQLWCCECISLLRCISLRFIWLLWFCLLVGFFQWPRLGQVTFSSTLEKPKTLKADKEVDVKQLYLHKPLESTWPKVNKQFLSSVNKPSDAFFTPLQRELFCIMNTYRDLFYPERNALTNGEEIRHAYCLHALNHVLKANSQVLSNNAKKRNQKPGTDNDDHRDQGLTRPKVRELHECDSPVPTLAFWSGSINILGVYPGLFLLLLSQWSVPGHGGFHMPLSCPEVTCHVPAWSSTGLLVSLFLCLEPWVWLIFCFVPLSLQTDMSPFPVLFLNLPVQKGASTLIFRISASSVGCHPVWDIPGIFLSLGTCLCGRIFLYMGDLRESQFHCQRYPS